MREADLYEQIGDSVEGYQKYRMETPEWTSYPVVRVKDDPNVVFEGDEGEPFPLVYTVQTEDGESVVAIEWNADVGMYDFANSVDTYQVATDANLVQGPDDTVKLEVVRHTDEYPHSSIDGKFTRPVDGIVLDEFLHTAGIDREDVSRIIMTHTSGEFMWIEPGDRVSAVIKPKAFTDLGLGAKALVDVYDATRSRDSAPSVTVFQDGLLLAAADSLFDLTSQGVPATL